MKTNWREMLFGFLLVFLVVPVADYLFPGDIAFVGGAIKGACIGFGAYLVAKGTRR